MDNIKTKFQGTALTMIVIILFNTLSVTAFPLLPAQLEGNIYIDENSADIGTQILVFSDEDILCSNYTTTEFGKYRLSCKANDPATEVIEGANEESKLKIIVNDITINGPIWKQGSFTEFNIIIWTTRQNNSEKIEMPSESVSSIDYILLLLIFMTLIIVLINKLIKKNEE